MEVSLHGRGELISPISSNHSFMCRPLTMILKRVSRNLIDVWMRRRSRTLTPPSNDQFEDILSKRNPFTSTRTIPRSPPQKSAIKAPLSPPQGPSSDEIPPPSHPPHPPPIFLFPLSPLPPRGPLSLQAPPEPGPSPWTVSKKEVLERRALRAIQNNTPPHGHQPLPPQNNTPPHGHQTLPPQNKKPPGSAKGNGLGLFFSGSKPKIDAVENEIKRQMDEEREREEEARAVHSPTAIHIRTNPDHNKKETRGWPGWILEQTNSHAMAISSVQGLEGTDEFQSWVESKRGSGSGPGSGPEGRLATVGGMMSHVNTPRRKIEAFKALRHADPDSFKSLMSRPELVDCETISPNPFLLALEYLLTSTISLISLIYAVTPLLSSPQPSLSLSICLRFLPLITWSWYQLNAWTSGHTCALGPFFGHYLVRQDESYPLHYHSAGLAECLTVAAIEAVFLGGTLFLGGLIFTLIKLIFFPPWTSDQISSSSNAREGDSVIIRSWRTVGQSAMGLVVIRQSNKRVTISTFPPSASSLGHSNMTTPHPQASNMRGGREGPARVLSGGGWMARREASATEPSVYSWGKMY